MKANQLLDKNAVTIIHAECSTRRNAYVPENLYCAIHKMASQMCKKKKKQTIMPFMEGCAMSLQ